MTVMMIRAKVKSQHVADLEDAAATMFGALEKEEPQGVCYSSYCLPDGETYIVLLELNDPTNNPLPSIAAFRNFQENLQQWLAEPSIPDQISVLGDYRSF